MIEIKRLMYDLCNIFNIGDIIASVCLVLLLVMGIVGVLVYVFFLTKDIILCF